MFNPDHSAVRYTHRGQVLHHLSILMGASLLPEERKLILLHCGVGTEAPLSFAALGRQLALGTAGEASRRYDKAVEKVRSAIPGSPLSFLVISYDAAEM